MTSRLDQPRLPCSGSGVQGLGFEFRVQGLGFEFRVQGLGFEFRVQGLGFEFRVQVLKKLYRVWVRSFGGFWVALPGFAFAFGFQAVGSGRARVALGSAGLGWAAAGAVFAQQKLYRVSVRSFAVFAGLCFLLLQSDFWIWGTAGGFCFLLVLFGWAGLGCRWVVFAHVEGKFETIEEAVQFEAKFTQFLFILLLRVQGFGFSGLITHNKENTIVPIVQGP